MHVTLSHCHTVIHPCAESWHGLALGTGPCRDERGPWRALTLCGTARPSPCPASPVSAWLASFLLWQLCCHLPALT